MNGHFKTNDIETMNSSNSIQNSHERFENVDLSTKEFILQLGMDVNTPYKFNDFVVALYEVVIEPTSYDEVIKIHGWVKKWSKKITPDMKIKLGS
jgi:hypothetical protein